MHAQPGRNICLPLVVQQRMHIQVKRWSSASAHELYLEICSTVAHAAISKLLLQILGRRLTPFPGVDVQYGCSGLQIGQWEHQLTVKPASHLKKLSHTLKEVDSRCATRGLST